MKPPRVTVLMSVFNGEKYLREAVDSILAQSFEDFEFLIIDDGSTDNSTEIIKSYDDPHICLVRNETNLGLAASLNKGIDLARGEYIARMDADDISCPRRLERQVLFMDSNSRIGGCGTWIRLIGERNAEIRLPTDAARIKCELLFSNPLAHSSVMLRKELFLRSGLAYRPDFKRSQDFDLWMRATRYFPMVNLGEPLLLLRLHSEQTSCRFAEEQLRTARMVWLEHFKFLGAQPTDDEIGIHVSIYRMAVKPSADVIDRADKWLCKLSIINNVAGYYPEPEFSQVLQRRWYAFCFIPSLFCRFQLHGRMSSSPLSRCLQLGVIERLEIFRTVVFRWVYNWAKNKFSFIHE